MKTRLILTLLTTLLIFAFTACSDSLGFGSDNEGEIMKVTGIGDGKILLTGSQVTASLFYFLEANKPLSVTVTIYDKITLNIVKTKTIDPDFIEQSAPLSLDLSGLPAGAYIIEWLAPYADGEVFQKSYTVFLTQSACQLVGMTSFPPLVEPEASALIIAHYRCETGLDPWFRWKTEDGVAFEGKASDGADRFRWTAPSRLGPAEITVEMFPSAPPEGTIWDFDSENRMSINLIVEKNNESDYGNYLAYINFTGNYKDLTTDRMFNLIGQPLLDVKSSVFGYYLNGRSGFSANEILLPVNSGLLQPFSLSFAVLPEEMENDKGLFSAVNDQGSFSFEVLTSSDSSLKAVLRSNGSEVISTSGVLKLTAGKLNNITLSVVPLKSSVGFMWFSEGIMQSSSLENFSFKALGQTGSSGKSIIGGTDGIKGIIDSFSVYVRDAQNRPSTEPGLFHNAMVKEIGAANLLLAHGFDGLYPEPGLTLGTNASLLTGYLALGPDSSTDFSLINFSGRKFYGALKYPQNDNNAQVRLSFYDLNGQTIFSIYPEGRIRSGEQVYYVPPFQNGFSFTVSGEPGKKSLSIDGLNLVVSVKTADSMFVRLERFSLDSGFWLADSLFIAESEDQD